MSRAREVSKISSTLSASVSNLNSEIQNFDAIAYSSASPSGAETGDIWVDTSTANPLIKAYDGTGWDTLGSAPVPIITGIAPDNLSQFKDEVMDKVRKVQANMPNKLTLKKLPSDTLTLNQIKNQIRKLIAEGTKVDLIVLDYIDCIMPDKNLGDEWKSEGSVMRGFESMCHELGLAGWTATQGNRSSISSDVVTTDQMGGSIKKAQVGHVIISVAKSLQQKEMNLATIAITKSRIGKDGIVFENCKFDNEMLVIDTEQSVTFLGLEEQKEEKNKQRIKELLEKRKQQTT